MTTHTFNVGDRVAVIRDNHIVARKVTAVREHRRRTQVTLSDGSKWDASGNLWQRGGYTTMYMEPMTPELLARLADQQRKAAIEWVSQNWTKLHEDVRAQLGDAAREIRRSQP